MFDLLNTYTETFNNFSLVIISDCFTFYQPENLNYEANCSNNAIKEVESASSYRRNHHDLYKDEDCDFNYCSDATNFYLHGQTKRCSTSLSEINISIYIKEFDEIVSLINFNKYKSDNYDQLLIALYRFKLIYQIKTIYTERYSIYVDKVKLEAKKLDNSLNVLY